jgi:hypothetical protein
MPSNTRNVKLGVCSVTFDGVDLGYTKGGVEVEVVTSTKKVMVDQFGESEVDEIIMGRTCRAKVPLAETTLENLVRIMPGAQLVGEGGAKATGTITFSTAAPVNGDKVTVNGIDFTFKTTPAPNTNEMGIPASISAAATALRDKLNGSTDPLISRITASASGAAVTITADENGVWGNAVTMTKTFVTGANCTIVDMASGVDDTRKKVNLKNGVGLSLLSFAKKLVFHPQSLPAADKSEDFTIPKAMTPGQLSFAYKLDEERIFNVEFSGYPDSDTRILAIVGDENIIG